MRLSAQSLNELHKTVEAFFNQEGDDGAEVADQVVAQVKENTYSLELFDALGCDDLGLVQNNPQLIKLYQNIMNDMKISKKSVIH